MFILQVHMSIPSCQKHSIVAIDDHSSREKHQKQHKHCTEHPEEVSKILPPHSPPSSKIKREKKNSSTTLPNARSCRGSKETENSVYF